MVKLERFRELKEEILPEIWTSHFSEKAGNLGVSMSSKVANLIKTRLSNYPMFILPISRLTGHDIVLLESVLDRGQGENFAVKVTGLEEYKKLGPSAPIRATFTFFTELEEVKNLTLIHGHFDANQMNSIQSSSILQNFCAAYSDDRLFHWVKTFKDCPNEFNFDEFMNVYTKN